MQGGRAFLRLHGRISNFLLCKSIAKIRNVPFPRPCGATGNDAQKLQMTEKEFTYIVYHHMHRYYGSLPDPVRLFFGDGNGVFLRKYNKTQNACGERE